ncbi:Fc receptor-like protein 5 [Pelodiscus sinensis]|uniref:Fc receptor-like protein 5 n=1 Tax=Pelodiscus sinensis TaxID=13735 RepID=UPI003F6D2CE4
MPERFSPETWKTAPRLASLGPGDGSGCVGRCQLLLRHHPLWTSPGNGQFSSPHPAQHAPVSLQPLSRAVTTPETSSAEPSTQLPAQRHRLSMELPLFLPLLALLQSLPWLVSPRDPLPAPTLALEHELTMLLPGQTAELTCQPPGSVHVSEYKFFYQKGQQGPSTVPHPHAGHVLDLTAEKERAGTYTCAYWAQQSSETSNSVSISIAAPQLTVSPPRPVYVAGEAVTLTCSAAGVDSLTRFQFYRDGEKIQSRKPTLIPYRHEASIKLLSVAVSHAGVYSCEYWRGKNGKEKPEFVSERSQNIRIAVTAPLPTPQLSVSPQQPVYVTGETVTLTCSAAGAPNDSMIWFYKDGQKMLSAELCLRPSNATASLQLSAQPGLQNSTFTCGCWRAESGREIESKKSRPVSITVTDHPPPPTLSVGSPSGDLKEGVPVFLTCTAPEDASERRLPSNKDGAEIVPKDTGSEIKGTEPRTGSVNVSVTHVLSASSVVEFACKNKENVSGTWSQAVNVTVAVPWAGTASLSTRDIVLIISGVALFLLGGLAALLCWAWRKTRIVKPVEGPAASEPREPTRDKDPRRDKKLSKATGAGTEQDSDVTYAQIALEAHTTRSKTRARPAKEEHVLYSEVATKPTQKVAK